jgi:hypothetical protein
MQVFKEKFQIIDKKILKLQLYLTIMIFFTFYSLDFNETYVLNFEFNLTLTVKCCGLMAAVKPKQI